MLLSSYALGLFSYCFAKEKKEHVFFEMIWKKLVRQQQKMKL